MEESVGNNKRSQAWNFGWMGETNTRGRSEKWLYWMRVCSLDCWLETWKIQVLCFSQQWGWDSTGIADWFSDRWYPVCDQGDLRGDPGISNLVLLFLFVSVKDLLSSTGGSETRHLTNHTHWVTHYIAKKYFIVCYKVGYQIKFKKATQNVL